MKPNKERRCSNKDICHTESFLRMVYQAHIRNLAQLISKPDKNVVAV